MTLKPFNIITDFITGQKVPNIGAEENRQTIEKLLVNDKGYSSEDIEVDADIEMMIGNEAYRSQIDLVVKVDRKRFMAIKCAAGSLLSREREILSASRIMDETPLPVSVVSDGATAIVLDTVSGKLKGEGLNAIPSKADARKWISASTDKSLPAERLEKEKLIFRTYDQQNVNVQRKMR